MTPRPPVLARWLTSLFLRGDAREVVVGDLDEAFARRIAAGQARRAATRAYWRESLGSITAVRLDRADQAERAPRPNPLQGIWLDVRYVLRGLAASRGFTAVAVLSLAVGIGATVALANVARTLLVTELPVERPGDLSWIFWRSDLDLRATNFGSHGFPIEGRSYDSNYSYPLYRAIKSSAAGGTEIAAFNVLTRINVAAYGQPPLVASGLIVDGDFFRVLRLPVVRGRGITPLDDTEDAPPVAVITERFWRRTLAANPGAIGSILAINGSPFEIVGITVPGFDGLSRGGVAPPADVFVAMAAMPIVSPSWKGTIAPRDDYSRQWIRLLARVPDREAGPAKAAAAATVAIRQALAAVAPGSDALRSVDVRLAPANRGLDTLRDNASQPLALLTGVVAIFLVVTCTNLAGMLTARGLARRRELAVRRALGAERWRLVRQALVESLVLASAGGLAGTVLAAWSGAALAAMLSDGLNAQDVRLSVDWGLLGIAALATLVTASVFGLAPAIRLTRADSTTELRNRATAAPGRQRGGLVLVAIQLAVTVPLIVGAMLFLRTLHNLSAIEVGFDPDGMVIFEVNPVRARSTVEARQPAAEDTARTRAILAALEAIPGISSATVLENALLTGWTSNTDVQVAGQRARMQMQAVGPRFFETLRMPLVAGRPISATDVTGAAPVVVINETAARKFFPGVSPVGQTFAIGSGLRGAPRTVEVIGVVADARYESLRRATVPTFYDAYLQRPGGTYTTFFAVRTHLAPAAIERSIREAVATVDGSLPVVRLETQQDKIARALGRERVLSRLLTIFGGFALLLASLGLHGITSYSVTRRTSEIGIRLALGAQRRQVLWLILRQVFVLAAAGLAMGLPLASAASPLAGAYLFGVPPRDPVTTVTAAAILIVVALVAGWLPARRAARMDPLDALRVE